MSKQKIYEDTFTTFISIIKMDLAMVFISISFFVIAGQFLFMLFMQKQIIFCLNEENYYTKSIIAK